MINLLPLLIRYRWAVSAGVLLVLAAILFWRFEVLASENERLEVELSEANGEIYKLNAIMVARERNKEEQERLIREIENAPETHNGPVARVLSDTIGGLSNYGG